MRLEQLVKLLVRWQAVGVARAGVKLGARLLVDDGLRNARLLRVAPCGQLVDLGLVDIADGRKRSGRVAVERREAHRGLGLVATVEHEPIVAVADRHELDGAYAGLKILGSQAIDAAAAGMRKHALEGLERLVDGRDRAVDTQHAGELLRVGK